jgi:hypothetical protein
LREGFLLHCFAMQIDDLDQQGAAVGGDFGAIDRDASVGREVG